MLGTFVRKIFGSKNDREVKRMLKAVAAINEQESTLHSLSDDALAAKRDDFRNRIINGETLNQILPEAFAVCREVSRRRLGLRHFDVQMVGGMTLHEGVSQKCEQEKVRRLCGYTAGLSECDK